ncbi:MAG: rhomboid family intramembrane serine protease [Alphaproteobacteria bacterium]|nr:rhomboid family intramembrane serine protease [Alphaproteobacteria bacterium]MDE2111053.1 rhomboid family intramembrane serine protease [Alphaproteobacteria bacterium]MDE2494753.1 rhomboid family intramembrane serine protease [Alphaproteobacteria bacterium]
MIPISDDNPTRLTPVVNWALILACVAVYVWEAQLGSGVGAVYARYGFTPKWLMSPPLSPADETGWSALTNIFTSMFLHGGILHLGGNMLYLWIFGNNIEDAMGHSRYTLFYFLSGIAAALTMAFMDPSSTTPMIGASGAISGVLGAYMLLYPRALVTVIVPLGIIFYPFRIRAVWVVGIWFAMQLFSAALSNPDSPGVAWWAHVGGFAAGLLLTPFLKSSHIPFFGPRRLRGPWG